MELDDIIDEMAMNYNEFSIDVDPNFNYFFTFYVSEAVGKRNRIIFGKDDSTPFSDTPNVNQYVLSIVDQIE